eukprot:2730792-Pleurochrysis_carterae.AAC.1
MRQDPSSAAAAETKFSALESVQPKTGNTQESSSTVAFEHTAPVVHVGDAEIVQCLGVCAACYRVDAEYALVHSGKRIVVQRDRRHATDDGEQTRTIVGRRKGPVIQRLSVGAAKHIVSAAVIGDRRQRVVICSFRIRASRARVTGKHAAPIVLFAC